MADYHLPDGDTIIGGVDGDESSSTAWGWIADRLLQKKDGNIDFTVLSVTVMTLGLIIIVEVVRHRIDHSAHGRPFFQAVLETLYNELSTLGIVEFAIWIVQSYYEAGYKTAQKAVFAKVHFALFYTAIFNALQTALVAFFATRVARYLWVKTETLELNHYVEVREEFDRVRRKLQKMHRRNNSNNKNKNNNNEKSDAAAGEEEEDWFGVGAIAQGWVDRIRHPYLKNKYNQLLVQVRFHELRVHFLDAYDLPHKFKVSDYLMRSQLNVLIRLVSVSVVAWLLLTGVANLLYFVMGVVAYYTEDGEIVGTAMTWLFVACMAGFVVIAIVLHARMKHVFSSIMHQEELWDTKTLCKHRDQMAVNQQLKLFWLSDPNIVIAAIQFMQFGYALALSAVIIFWDTLALGDVAAGWYLFIIFLSYAVFVVVVTQVIPWYTLCTSLGQLVNLQRLQETVAAFRLEEARRTELGRLECQGLIPGDDNVSDEKKGIPQSSHPAAGPQSAASASLSRATSAVSLSSYQENAELIAELVNVDTDSLRIKLPEAEKEALEQREQLRKSRRKSVSDGVGAMSRLGKKTSSRAKDDLDATDEGRKQVVPIELPETAEDLKPNDTTVESLRDRRRRSRRMKSVSDSAAVMWMASASTTLDVPEPVEEENHEDEEEDEDCVSNALVALESNVKASPVDYCDDTSVDGHSDTDDIPQAEMDLDFLAAAEYHRPTLYQRFHEYYLSKRFVLISNVFGTLVAFFMVGQRVEGFFVSEGLVDSYQFVVYAFPLTVTFWVLFTWLSMFLFSTGLIVHNFGIRGSLDSNRERQVFVAAVIDVIIAGACLVLLCTAETERCCYPEAGTSEEDSSYRYRNLEDYKNEDEAYGIYDPQPAPCSCPVFGSRTYGGLGTIEPYTSLIALRMLRHWLAKRFVVAFWPDSQSDKNTNVDTSQHDGSINPFAVFGHSDDHGDHPSNMQNERGNVAELWQIAVARYPEIVAKHGEFSEELLRAMLGVPILGTLEVNTTPVESTETDSVFVYPNAKLVRSMRRCDRKLLPILDTWIVVDVVMTSKEIVYLDATDVDAEGIDTQTSDEVKQAITATKGGKGLRLCDVAAGRRVMGQHLLSDIESIYVEREFPHELAAGESGDPGSTVENTEYWRKDGHDYDRATHWCSIKQDVVKIHTADGFTLCLRFYSDLDDAEAHPGRLEAEHEEAGPLFKNNAFQWAQTAVRFCGPLRLKQPLPHFGDNTSEELRDVLIVKHDDEHRHHRIRSSGEAGLRLLTRGATNLAAALRRDESPRRSSAVTSPNTTLAVDEDAMVDPVEMADEEAVIESKRESNDVL